MRPLVDTRLARPGCEVLVRRRDARDGRWVVFLHGAGMDGEMFDAQFPAVPDDWGICAWDARGHGASTLAGRFRYADLVDDLTALLASVDASEVVLVGQSMGGNLAQTLVASRPDAVQRLVLIDCTDNHGPLSGVERFLLSLAVPILACYPWELAVRQSAEACGTRAETRTYAANALSATGRTRFLEVMGFGREAVTPDLGYRLPVPTLLVLGEHDRSGNIAAALRRWPERDPRARLVVIADAAHNANQDAPGPVNEAIGVFLGW
ncbi:MAG: alpha/beta hydrolase [Propionicimonas sp.]|uniref:alpha/beta fold hydrolase n=1 Tax=Propionicimonas sp. TaxID=1955623 RepID=UPI003D0E66FE